MTATYTNFGLPGTFVLPMTPLGVDLASGWYELDVFNRMGHIQVYVAAPTVERNGRMFADAANLMSFEDGEANEKPVHGVTVSSFRLGRTAVPDEDVERHELFSPPFLPPIFRCQRRWPTLNELFESSRASLVQQASAIPFITHRSEENGSPFTYAVAGGTAMITRPQHNDTTDAAGIKLSPSGSDDDSDGDAIRHLPSDIRREVGKAVGKEIKRIRMARGISLKDAATRLGFRWESALYQTESGKKPGFQLYPRLEKLFGLEVGYFGTYRARLERGILEGRPLEDIVASMDLSTLPVLSSGTDKGYRTVLARLFEERIGEEVEDFTSVNLLGVFIVVTKTGKLFEVSLNIKELVHKPVAAENVSAATHRLTGGEHLSDSLRNEIEDAYRVLNTQIDRDIENSKLRSKAIGKLRLAMRILLNPLSKHRSKATDFLKDIQSIAASVSADNLAGAIQIFIVRLGTFSK